MDYLAGKYAERRLQVLQRAAIRNLSRKIRQTYIDTEPLRKAAAERRKASRRNDSFVMVDPEYN